MRVKEVTGRARRDATLGLVTGTKLSTEVPTMSKFRFTLSNAAVRQEGMVESDTFAQAVDQLWEHVEVRRGDVLEIGVKGFPPARYECIGEFEEKPFWKAA
jgi:hypothetical protein